MSAETSLSLTSFLESYFHAEWTSEAPSWEAVIDLFRLHVGPQDVRAIVEAIAALSDGSAVGEQARKELQEASFYPDQTQADVPTEKWLASMHERLLAPSRRTDILAEYAAIVRDSVDSRTELRRQDLRSAYANLIPWVPIARCPFGSDAVFLRLDVDGIDGLWWDFHNPVRPHEAGLPATFLEMTGSMRVEQAPTTPFLIVPGPGAPFVLPHLLDREGVSAVIIGLEVGGLASTAVSYFARSTTDLDAPPAWGSNESTPRPAPPAIKPVLSHEMAYDFDLRPWVDSGKLLWISAMDQTLELRRGVEACPYLGLEGRRSITYLQDGRLWWRDPETGEPTYAEPS